MTTENLAVCVFFLIEQGDSVLFLANCYLFVEHCCFWMGYLQTPCFCKFSHLCYCSSYVSFWRMIDKGCDSFRCRGWYCQGGANEDKFGFPACFARSAFYLRCQVEKMIENMCGVNDYTFCLKQCKLKMGPAKIFKTTKFRAKVQHQNQVWLLLTVFLMGHVSLVFEKWEGGQFQKSKRGLVV